MIAIWLQTLFANLQWHTATMSQSLLRLNLMDASLDHLAEVGYWISKEHRGKGLCTSALKMLADFSLDVMGFRRLEALADFDNLASQKVMESAVFQRDALLKNRATKRDGRQIDMALYSMARG
jgi:RimJ/RimL family protein N-acetyltransferase